MKTEDVRIWMQRISKCKDLQRKQISNWNDIISLYSGTYFNDKRFNNYSEVNFVYEFEKVKVSTIYARNPKIFVRARSRMYAPFAQTAEKVVNYYWDDKLMKGKMKQAVLHASLIPPSWIEIGYSGDIIRKKVSTEGQSGVFEDTIKNDDLFVEFRSSYEIIFPDGYHDIRSAPYIVRIEKVKLIDFLANPIYKNKDKIIGSNFSKSSGGLKNAVRSKLGTFITAGYNNFRYEANPDDDNKEVTLYHVWDKRGYQRFTLVDSFTDDSVYEKEWNYLIDGFPIYPIFFNEIPATENDANAYPMSDVQPMIPQLKDLSIINNAMIRHGKRQGAVVFVRKGALSPSEITNISKGGELEVIELSVLGKDNIDHFVWPQVPSDWYRLRAQVIEDLMRISGYQQLLGQQQGVETAEESSNLRMGQMARTSEESDTIEYATAQIAKGMIGLLWQFKNDSKGREEIAKIIGEPMLTEEMWPSLPVDPFTGELDIDKAREIIQKEIQFKVEAGSTRPPKDEALESKYKLDAINLLMATVPNEIDSSALPQAVLEAVGFKDISVGSILKKGTEQQEMEAAAKENQLLEKNIPCVVSPSNRHQAHISIHSQGIPSQAKDQHILEHSQFMQMQNPNSARPQQGDMRSPKQAVNPEMMRQGVTGASDISAAVNNVAQGTKPNT